MVESDGCICAHLLFSEHWLMKPFVFPGDLRCRASPCRGQACVSSSVLSSLCLSCEMRSLHVTGDLGGDTPSCFLAHYFLFSVEGDFLHCLWPPKAVLGLRCTHCFETSETLTWGPNFDVYSWDSLSGDCLTES